MKKKNMSIGAAVLALALAAVFNIDIADLTDTTSSDNAVNPRQHTDNTNAEQLIAAAYAEKRSDIQVQGAGKVSRILTDDNDGSRHQRFLLELASGQTLLVAHNIDLAPRINNLRIGDQVGFNGEYEWNDRGGVIHWTHHDPKGYHEAGWLEHQGKRYQ